MSARGARAERAPTRARKRANVATQTRKRKRKGAREPEGRGALAARAPRALTHSLARSLASDAKGMRRSATATAATTAQLKRLSLRPKHPMDFDAQETRAAADARPLRSAVSRATDEWAAENNNNTITHSGDNNNNNTNGNINSTSANHIYGTQIALRRL